MFLSLPKVPLSDTRGFQSVDYANVANAPYGSLLRNEGDDFCGCAKKEHTALAGPTRA